MSCLRRVAQEVECERHSALCRQRLAGAVWADWPLQAPVTAPLPAITDCRGMCVLPRQRLIVLAAVDVFEGACLRTRLRLAVPFITSRHLALPPSARTAVFSRPRLVNSAVGVC